MYFLFFFFFKHNTAYDMRISDWSSDVCSSDLALMGADFELVARRLVHVRRTQHVVATDTRRQRDRAAHHSASALGGVDDLSRGLIDQLVVEGFQADADLLGFHGVSQSTISEGGRRGRAACAGWCAHSAMIFESDRKRSGEGKSVS